ncbi:aromatic-L-amino-acid decarboxylase-like [Chrysoperla carnea]|uniref:aromatic-L-amino-acid decarboxylase-like n=1 Tax=Chrysoperla carnea TaxID=189513 RepID=UPI001D093EE8|nr:aromatic-L-amino-acid decarboxylase-like [Chrysoperla carnea]
MNVEEFRENGKSLIDYMCDYVSTIEKRRVIPNVEPGYLRPILPDEAPEDPEKWSEIFKDIETKIMPGVTHWNHPHFHAYFPAGNSFPSILGDMLSDVIGSIGFSWASNPVCTELEVVVLDWLGSAMGLPSTFLAKATNHKSGGVIAGSASESIFTCLLAARAQSINYLKGSLQKFDGSIFLSKLVAYCSKEAHSCVAKACMISTIKLRILDTDEHLSLRGETLEKAIREDIEKGYFPFFVAATLGTTAACAFDNLEEIGTVCKKFKSIWFHVDAAYAGSAFICPELKHFLKGIHLADSINTNSNKWFLTAFDCSCLWVRDRIRLTNAMSVYAAYYPENDESVEAVDYRHWGIPLSRRMRSLKLWFVMRCYGLKGLREYIRNHIQLAKYFESLVLTDNNFEIMNEVHLGLVCFRLKLSDNTNKDLLARINYEGKIHMIPSQIKGKLCIRFCVVYEHATKDHIDYAWNVIKEHANNILSQQQDTIKAVRPPSETKQPVLRQISRQLSRRLSFVRSLSKEQYNQTKQKQNNSLSDGASPLIMPSEDDEDNILDMEDMTLDSDDVFPNNK